MYLALNEMRKEKIRYGLIIAVMTLISYLIFILSALAMGLAHENTAAVNNWQLTQVAMSKDANGNLSQSLLTNDDMNKIQLTGDQTAIGIVPMIVKAHRVRVSSMFVGIQKNDLIYHRVQLTQGHLPKDRHDVLISSKLTQKGLKIGDHMKLGMLTHDVKIVGYVKNAMYNMSPVIYGNLNNWRDIKGVSNQFYASGIITSDSKKIVSNDLKRYNRAQLFNKMPGYTAQNSTFIFMIGFLLVISAVIVTIFLYILTIQKIPNFAVLRAQGVPGRYLVINTVSETLIIMCVSVLISGILCAITAWFIPEAVPMFFDVKLIILSSIGLVLTGVIGAIVPVRMITKIDPISVMGG
ncbi:MULTISPECIES: ABC transporter permease [Leuconostoc]|uniref:Putative hemin transport system permease protein HrtB n=2 Tax=Leuconostoc kimchii TaxID=136609 RepID=D5T0B0_LEUKI|nr:MULTISPECIES: ABC transporter permease [Leuconostoc]ADG39709.1 putative ABC transporter permease protein [Leuconostoc kimchii IMSNU 11154]AEJ30430.1 putative ABC transporter permease protein [Leuconostoc sp. C2]QBR47491.1 ABC transporter permease [Leuconostoc kimchii]